MTIAQTLLPEFDQETAGTRKVLSLVPDAHGDWKPHEKSFSLGALASHLCNMPFWGLMTLTLPELDLSGPEAMKGGRIPYSGTTELLRRFDAQLQTCREALVSSTDEVMHAMWSLKMGDAVFFTMPRIAVLRSTVLNHMVHHRGQLTVYLRMLDVPLPELYGPTADTQRR
jgi:uncharacterized damage-inducible protein DinB